MRVPDISFLCFVQSQLWQGYEFDESSYVLIHMSLAHVYLGFMISFLLLQFIVEKTVVLPAEDHGCPFPENIPCWMEPPYVGSIVPLSQDSSNWQLLPEAGLFATGGAIL